MKKIFGWTFLFLLMLTLGLLISGQARQALRERPLHGQYTALVADFQAPLGDFTVTWQAEPAQLTVTPKENPDHVVWQTAAAEPFIAAAVGEGRITESRGSFTISDERQVVCTRQQIRQGSVIGKQLTFLGVLECDNGEEVDYRFTLAAVAPGQLQFLIETGSPAINRIYLTYASESDEGFYGFGEQFTHFNLKGKRVPIFVQEQGIGRGLEPITTGANLQAGAGGDAFSSYAGVPHYLTSHNRSLYLETYEYAVFDLRQPDQVQIELHDAVIRGRILHGESPKELISLYTGNIGRMRPLPNWILEGAIIGMQGGTERVRSVWQELERADVPISGFWLQDWVGQRTTSFGKQLWWNWVLDEERYPGWEQLVADLEASDIRMLTYASPFLADVSEKPNATRNLFAEAAEQGYLVTDEAGEPYLIQNTSFSAGLLDLTNPAAVAWMQAVLLEEVVGAGASGWLADFGEALPMDSQLFAGDPAEEHNAYPERWAQLNREAIDSLPNGEEIVFFNRSGYRESPRYATLFWLGDQLVTWDEYDGIKTAVTGLLSSGLSGYAYNHSDIGGYTTITNPLADYHRSQELLLRWMDLNALTPIFRTHEGNIPEANVQFYTNEETLMHLAWTAKLYAAWADYRKQLVAEAAQTGLPVVRPLFVEFPEDARSWQAGDQQFMLGSELLVAPVLDPGVDSLTVYLPPGEWVHLWSEEVYSGGNRYTVDAPLGQPPVFYPVGSAVGKTFRENLIGSELTVESSE